MYRTPCVLIAAILFLKLCVVFADDPDPKVAERWGDYFKVVAKSYSISLKSDPEKQLTVVATPVIVYANPAGGHDTHGSIFIWTRNGRAEVIGDIWARLTTPDPNSPRLIKHSLHSLSSEPLIANGMNDVSWSPEEPGVEFMQIPDAAIPATTAAARLTQMRAITRSFSGYDIPASNNPRVEERERMLRLLPTPLYRYVVNDAKSDSGDGAVFAFFFDWDPEIFLVLEVRITKEGPRWHYGFARMDNKSLRVELNGTTVWKNTERNFGGKHQRYYSVSAITLPPNTIPSESK